MWPRIPLGTLLSAVIDHRGRTPKKLDGHFVDRGIPVISAKNVKSGRIDSSNDIRFVSPEMYEKWMPQKLSSGDVVLTSEAPLGEAFLLRDNKDFCLGQRLFGLRADGKGLDSTYLYYFLISPTGQQRLHARATGSTAQGIRQSELLKVEIDLPPLTSQRAIASVLRMLDDKIEVNRRMDDTLEAIARASFKSWFIESSRSNTLRIGTLGEVALIAKNQVAPSEIDGDSPYIGLEHMPKRRIALDESGKARDVASNKFRFCRGDLLFGKLRPYFHKVGIAPFDGVCSTDILVIRPKQPHWFAFLLGHLSSDELIAYADMGTTGTKMPRTSWAQLERFEIAIPTADIAGHYNEMARPLVERIIHNIEESKTLAILRDTLLPKLMAGQIRLKQPQKLIEARA